MRAHRYCRGQSAIELVLLFTVVVAALIALQVYFKRAIEGRGRQSADQIGSQWSFSDGAYTKTMTANSTTTETTTGEGITQTDIGTQTQNQHINETISKSKSLWDN